MFIKCWMMIKWHTVYNILTVFDYINLNCFVYVTYIVSLMDTNFKKGYLFTMNSESYNHIYDSLQGFVNKYFTRVEWHE